MTEPVTWPRRARRRLEVLRNVERYLEVDGAPTRFRPYRLDRRYGYETPMHTDLHGLLGALAGRTSPGDLLARALSDEETTGLWEALLLSFDELRRQDRLHVVSDWNTWDGHTLLGAIAVVVAHRMEYVMLPLRNLLARARVPWEEEDKSRTSWRRSVEGFELFAVSFAMVVARDMRSVGWLARQPLERGFSGLCRHYSRIVQTLFWSAKRATGRWAGWDVLSVSGRPHHYGVFGHSWNWLCDYRSNVIYTFDLTGADWLVDHAEAQSIFNEGFDGYRWFNASAFLAELLVIYATEHDTEATARIGELVPRLVDVGTVGGEARLYNLCHQPGLSDDARERILEHLEAAGFGRQITAWRARLRLDGFLNPTRHVVDARRQHALLDEVLSARRAHAGPSPT